MSRNYDQVMFDLDGWEKKVMEENFAALIGSGYGAYRVAQNCQLIQIGEQFRTRYYGLGFKLGEKF